MGRRWIEKGEKSVLGLWARGCVAADKAEEGADGATSGSVISSYRQWRFGLGYK